MVLSASNQTRKGHPINDMTVFIFEETEICIADSTIRTIRIELGITNSAVAEAIFDPKNLNGIQVRSLAVEQPTEEGMHADVTVPSVV